MSEITLGIDLGTSNTCVAIKSAKGTFVLPDQDGDVIHPSVVTYLDNGIVVGLKAKNLMQRHTEQTVASSKRLIGRYFFSEEVKTASKILGCKLMEGPQNSVKIDVGNKIISPTEVAGDILKYVKMIAEKNTGQEISQAVVTVPAYFNDNQRNETKKAALKAGLKVLRVINEPTAAALAYGFGKGKRQRIAVYDLGGGTFDISILDIGDHIYEVLGTSGDSFLGGDDFDRKIVNRFLQIISERYGKTAKLTPRLNAQLTAAAEKMKNRLSTYEEAELKIPSLQINELGEVIDFEAKIYRSEFAKMTFDLISRTLKVCDEAVISAKITAKEVDGVVLVGGPTRLPFVRQAVSHYFGKDPEAGVNPDSVVALGAAILGHSLTNPGSKSVLMDVTPMSLRIGTVENLNEIIIEKNTPVPVSLRKKFHTAHDNQDFVSIVVYQGQDRENEKCELLGEFKIEGLEKKSRGEVIIDVDFSLDANGILNVKAYDAKTQKGASVVISLNPYSQQ